MKYQNVYTSNFDYDNTLQTLRESPVANVTMSPGTIKHQGYGLLRVRFKGFKDTILIGRKKVIISFSSKKEKDQLMMLLRPHLRTKKDTLAWLKPQKTQVAMDWPPRSGFKFLACPEEYIYRLQSIRKLPFRKTIHPLLWFLLFIILSFPIWPRILSWLLG